MGIILVSANPIQLNWSHFREVNTIEGTGHSAQVAAVIHMPPVPHTMRVGSLSRFRDTTIRVALNHARTLVQRGTQNDALLRHEQGHYDLTRIAAKVFALDMQEMSASTDRVLRDYLSQSFSARYEFIARIEIRYDTDTSHGSNSLVQARWEHSIQIALGAAHVTEIEGLRI